MSALVRSELLKLRTVRATTGVLAAAAALGPVFVVLQLLTSDPASAADVRSVLTNAGIAGLLILLYGVGATTGEQRHDTIASTLVASHGRGRALRAKAIAMALCGLLAGLVAAVATAAVALPWLAVEGAPSLAAGDLLSLLAGQLAYTTLAGVIGVGIGALLRSQALAIAGLLIWLLVVETTVARFLPFVDRFGLEGSAAALARAPEIGDLPQGAALAVYGAWALAALAAGTAVFARRDVI